MTRVTEFIYICLRTIDFEAHSVGAEYSSHLKIKAFSKFWPNTIIMIVLCIIL